MSSIIREIPEKVDFTQWLENSPYEIIITENKYGGIFAKLKGTKKIVIYSYGDVEAIDFGEMGRNEKEAIHKLKRAISSEIHYPQARYGFFGLKKGKKERFPFFL